MENITRNKDLSTVQKIVIFSFLALITGLYHFIMNLMMLNLGCGEMRYPRLFLHVLPALYIIHINFRKRTLKFPHLMPFLLMIFAFMLFEKYLSAGSDSNLHDYQFVWQYVNIYICFLMLINLGLDRAVFYKVIEYSIYMGVFICFVTIIGYMGFLNMSTFENSDKIFYSAIFENIRPHHLLHTNGVSYLFAFTILLIIIKLSKEQEFAQLRILMYTAVVLCLTVIVFINGSRGALAIAIVLVCCYLRVVCRFLPKRLVKRLLISVGMILVLVVGLYYGSIKSISTSQHSMIHQRYTLPMAMKNSARNENLVNAWKNFKDYPFTGVGYKKAAIRDNRGTRSNNQFLHLMASSGIVFFVIYIFFNYRFFVVRLNMLMRREVVMSVFFIVVYLSLRRPIMDILAIVGYIAYFFYNDRVRMRRGNGMIINNRENQEN
jgi:hypothetical protein